MASEARMSEEKAARAMVDAARLADELRIEQDMAGQLERERKVRCTALYCTTLHIKEHI
jgi:hypothetical protein